MSNQFNPTLAYLYRRWLVRQLIKEIPKGRFLEVGIGSGNLYIELLVSGSTGLCVDFNRTLVEAHQCQKTESDEVEFKAMDFFDLNGLFDLVLAFEVLEHYEEDLKCLERFWELLKPNGLLLISVPAHGHRWTSNDTAAGHARRYERVEIIRKIELSGFKVKSCWCYGFPVLNWTYPLSSALFPNRKRGTFPKGSTQGVSITSRTLMNYEKTHQSGTRIFVRFSKWLLKEWLWLPLLQMQWPTLNRDIGIGYIIKCQKINSKDYR